MQAMGTSEKITQLLRTPRASVLNSENPIAFATERMWLMVRLMPNQPFAMAVRSHRALRGSRSPLNSPAVLGRPLQAPCKANRVDRITAKHTAPGAPARHRCTPGSQTLMGIQVGIQASGATVGLAELLRERSQSHLLVTPTPTATGTCRTHGHRLTGTRHQHHQQARLIEAITEADWCRFCRQRYGLSAK